MPITGKQFELGIDSAIEKWMKKIHSFLIGHRDQAFTKKEIWEQCRSSKYPFLDKEDDFEVALEELLETGAVDTRLVRGEGYYRVGPNPLEI